MFGFEILDVVIGLVFVYLLLSLFATALNEYIAAVFSLRGKELARGLGRLLDDLDEGQALSKARDGIGTKLTTQADLLTEQLYNHHLIRPLATRQGWMTRFWRWVRRHKEAAPPRLPSYIPARSFALALLDVLGIDRKDASLAALLENPESDTTHESAADAFRAAREGFARAEEAARAAKDRGDAQATAAADEALGKARIALSRARLAHVLAILKHESSLDLTEHLTALAGLPNANRLPVELQAQVAGLMTGAQTQLQKLHDGVEVWFNNAMDRVSGAYKRTAQGWLFAIGVAIAVAMNADTIQMWRHLSQNDELRAAMAQRAAATVAGLDTVVHRTPQERRDAAEARARYHAARAELDKLELKFGWTMENRWPAGFWPGALKVLGLLLTAVAISLGAPFWFDLLNKVVSIRTAGRSPAERPKSPEADAKRRAERAPK